jgi:hypothetical protein
MSFIGLSPFQKFACCKQAAPSKGAAWDLIKDRIRQWTDLH